MYSFLGSLISETTQKFSIEFIPYSKIRQKYHENAVFKMIIDWYYLVITGMFYSRKYQDLSIKTQIVYKLLIQKFIVHIIYQIKSLNALIYS